MWRSRKFLTLILDTVVSLATLLLTTFLAPEHIEFALAIVAILQPVAIAVIVMWGIEDAAAMKAGIWTEYRGSK